SIYVLMGFGAMRLNPSYGAVSTPLAHIDKMARDGRRSRHRRRNEVRAASIALASFEVAVGSRGAAFAGLELVRIHGEAHRAPRLAPLKTGFDKNLVETLSLRLFLHQA